MIPPELLANPGPPLIIFFLASAVVVLWRLRTSAETEIRQLIEKMGDQRVLVEKATNLVMFREFERDQCQKECDRCERELERCKHPAAGTTT